MKSRKAKKPNRARRSSQNRQRRVLLERLEERQMLAADLPFDTTGSLLVDYLPANHALQDTFNAPLSQPSIAEPDDIVGGYLANHAGDVGISRSDAQSFRVTSETYSDLTGLTHVYLQQTYQGLDVMGAVAAGHLNERGQLISANSSFVPLQPLTSISPAVDAAEAVELFADAFDYSLDSPQAVGGGGGVDRATSIAAEGNRGNINANLVWHPSSSGLELGWEFIVDSDTEVANYRAVVSGDGNKVLRVEDRVLRASYNVFPLPLTDPNDGAPSVVIDPHDPVASPFGWHDTDGRPGAEHTDTRGNNVFAQEDGDADDQAGFRPSGGSTLDFNFPFDYTAEPVDNEEFAITNAFYVTNVVHDVTYNNGFDEISGNFQANNYTGQGFGGDPITLDVHDTDAGSVDNAFYIPSVDGDEARLTMGIGTTNAPSPDSSVDNMVLVHEYAHGISTRLTGGPADDAALADDQPRALGEGWSDYFALAFTQKPADTRDTPRVIAEYYLPSQAPDPPGQGIRTAPYCFDFSVCSTNLLNNYDPGAASPHPNGESWAAALWDANWLLTEKYGFDPDLSQGEGGNRVMMKLVIEGMKLQPVQPTYVTARNAVLSADIILNKGVNLPELWQAFARRGIGFSSVDVTDSDDPPDPAFDLPPDNLRAIVSGTTYVDVNGDFDRNGNDTPLAGATVYVDVNENGRLDTLEPSTISDANGRYEFEFLAPTRLIISQVPEPGFRPTEGAGGQTVIVVNGQDVTNLDFGNEPGVDQGLGGVVFLDGADGSLPNGQHETDVEPGVGGVLVYLDITGNGRPDIGEPNDITAADGTYSLPVPGPGTYDVRIAVPIGSEQTAPQGNVHRIVVGDELTISGLSFGITGTMRDFGMEGDDSPRHTILGGFHLGSELTAEMGVTNDNDDGVRFNAPLTAGVGGTLDVDVSTGGQPPGYLHGFIDHDHDADTPALRLFTPVRLGDGSHTVPFTVPATAMTGPTDVYFRYAWGRLLGPTGDSTGGEVEVYNLPVFGDIPIANPDSFVVDQGATDEILDVLDDDFSSSSGPIFVSGLQGGAMTALTDRGNTVEIGPAGANVLFTATPDFSGADTFTYTISDNAVPPEMSTTTVDVLVTPTIQGPRANDDYFVLNFPNSTSGFITVQANDFPVNDPTLRLNRIVEQGQFGMATINDNNTATLVDDVVEYTVTSPGTTPVGTVDSFRYELLDADGFTSVATVHVLYGNIPADQLVMEVTLETRSIDTDQVITSIDVGDMFILEASVRDARTVGGVELGIFSAYFDVSVVTPALASFIGNPQPDAQYSVSPNGDTLTPNLIDEAGGIQVPANPPVGAGGEAEVIWRQVVQADATGQLVFQPNPGDDANFQTLLLDPSRTIQIDEISYIPKSIIVNLPGGEGEARQNPLSRFDVNADNDITMFDALALVQWLKNALQGSGESESVSARTMYPDVSGDGEVDFFDLVMVVGELYRKFNPGALGEGEFTTPVINQLTDATLTEPLVVETARATTSPLALSATQSPLTALSRTSENRQVETTPANEQLSLLTTERSFELELVDRSHADLDETLTDEFAADVSSAWLDEQTP